MKKLISTYIILCIVYSCSKSDSIINTNKNLPGSPILLTASFDTNYVINLKWIDSSSNESGFKIERKIGTGSYNIIGTVSANVCTYIDYITYPNTTYTYRVNAFNNDGNSIKYTNEVAITPTNLKDSLIVNLSRDTVEYNGWDMVSIQVKDTAGNDVTKRASLFLNSDLNSSPIFNNVYYPTAIGNYTISATMGSLSSNKSPLIVVPYTRSIFTHKILVEDYTSMYCGYCPRVFFELDTYTKTHSNCAWVSIHTSGLGPDKYAYTYCSDMESKYSIQGYPTSIIDRKLVWQEDNSTLMNEATKWTGLGLSINSTVNGNTISGTANVKFNFTTNKPLKIVVAIVESGLLANQENYYSLGGPTPYLYNGKNPRIYLNQATVATSINLLEGYINRAVGLTIAAKDFGVKAVRNSNRSGDIEGLCTALDSLNKNVKVPTNLAALIAKGYSAAKETAFETLISSLKGDNTAQNAKINQREVLVKNNHVAVNNIWAKINDLCDAGKRIYSTGADESKQQFTISTIKKRMRNDAKKTSITGVTIEPKARIEFKPLTVGRKRVVTTDAKGAYDLKGIMPGEYLGTLIVKGKPNVNADVVIVTGASVVENFGSIR